jgi:hypothetical protein
LLPKSGDCENGTFGMVIVAKNYVHDLTDRACFVGGTVDVVDRDCPRQGPGCELVLLHKRRIEEKAGGAAIQQRCHAMYFLRVGGFNLYLEVEGISAGCGGNDISAWEAFFPSGQTSA